MRAALPALALLVALALPARADEESPDDLPAGAGREETFFACTACHGFAIVRQQGLPAERWRDTLADMVKRHNMPEPDAAEAKLIVEYLAGTFPPRRPAYSNPFLKR